MRILFLRKLEQYGPEVRKFKSEAQHNPGFSSDMSRSSIQARPSILYTYSGVGREEGGADSVQIQK